MKDPSFSKDPALYRDPVRRMLPDDTIKKLDVQRRVLQIIIVAMIMGVVIFLGVALVQLNEPWTFLGPNCRFEMLILAAACLLPAAIVPAIIRRATGDAPTSPPAKYADPLNAEAMSFAKRYQTSAIAGAALLEGPALANGVGLLLSGDLIHLAVVVVLLLGLVFWIPGRSGYLNRIEREIENARLKGDFDR